MCADLGRGAEGYLVIDSIHRNGSAGGLRVAEDLTLAEVTALAREMTLKFAFIGRRSGGAKSGLRLPPGMDASEKRRLLGAFGRHLGPLLRRGVYAAGTDMACGPDDLRAFYAGAGRRLGRVTDTAGFTALVAADALAACRIRLGAPPRPLRLAIEGFGAAASGLLARLSPREFSVTVLSTARGALARAGGFDARELLRARERHGDALVEHLGGERLPLERLFVEEVDLLVPSARTGSLTAERARTLQARCVAPLANAPYGEGALAILASRGIVALPGYVVNCGGVFASSLADSGVPLSSIERLSACEYRAVVGALLEASGAVGLSPAALAEELALARLEERRAADAPEPAWRRAVRLLAADHAPRLLLGVERLRWFRRNLVALRQRIERRGTGCTEEARRPAEARARP